MGRTESRPEERSLTSGGLRTPASRSGLYHRGALRAYALGGVEHDGADVDMSTSRTIGSQSIYLANMFLWGPGFFTSSAFTMATIVERLLRALYREEAA
jgi:hypothetical protein